MGAPSLSETLTRLAQRVRQEPSGLAEMLSDLCRATGSDFAVITRVHPGTGKVHLQAAWGLSRGPGERNPGEELTSPFLHQNLPLLEDSPFQAFRKGWEQDPFLQGEGTGALLLAGQGAGEEALVTAAGRRGGKPYDNREGELFSVVAAFLFLAGERAHLTDDAVRWRDRDPLTGLAVYHAFYETLRREVSLARRQNRKSSLALLGLEGLDAFAVRKGRGAAEDLFKGVTQIMLAQLRDTDIVARYGPNEFAILLSDVNGALGAMVADRILRGVNEGLRGNEGGVVFRMGFACFPEEATTHERLIEYAETALLRAREEQSGKAIRYKRK